MDEKTKRQIEKEIEDFFYGLFEKHQDLRIIQMHKMMRPDAPKMSCRHVNFEIYRRHMVEEDAYKIDFNVVEYNDMTRKNYVQLKNKNK